MLLHVFVLPENAHATLDGAPLPSLPFTAEVPLDRKMHHVEASAPGHRSKNVVVVFDRDREVSVVLDKLPPDLPMPRMRRRESAAGSGAQGGSAEGSEDAEGQTPSEPASEAMPDEQETEPKPSRVVPEFLENPYE